jgi:hypothetical protein
MELHGSAALSRRQRRRLVGLVACGMTITAAAVIVGCSRQTGSKWVGRARRSLQPPEALAEADAGGGRAGGAAGAAGAAPGAAPAWLGVGSGGLDRVCDPRSPRLLASLPARAGRGRPLRARAPGGAPPRRRQETGADHPAGTPGHGRPLHPSARQGRLALPLRRHRRRQPPRLRPPLPGRDGRLRPRLPRGLRPLLQPLRNPDRARAHRQRQVLQAPLAASLRPARDQSETHPPLPPANQGRALHPQPCSRRGPTPAATQTSVPAPKRSAPHSTPTIAAEDTAPSAG